MSILVNWHAAAAISCGLVVLLGLTWLLRGGRAAARMCGAIGFAVMGDGLMTGRAIAIGCGAIILGTACWCLRGWR